MRRKREKECSRGSGRPRYIGTLAIFSSMHTSTGMSRMHSERCVPRACTAEREARGRDARQWKMHAPRYTTCASKLQLQSADSVSFSLSLSLFLFFFRLSLLVSLMRPPPRPRLERGSSETASGLLNNSLCGLAERCVCTCIDAGLFREIANARCHPPRVTTAETLFRCNIAAAFRSRLVKSPFPSLRSDDWRREPRKAT